MRKKHPNKEIEMSVQYAESLNWRYIDPGRSAHSWGRIFCPLETPEGCIISIFSTPKNTTIHAKQIRKRVDKCKCMKNGEI